MDGGRDLNDRKINTVFSRVQDQITMCEKVNPLNQTSLRIFPPLGIGVFVGVIERLGITILQSDFEADEEIASLAKELDCYVISNDSDFYAFDVPFVILDSMNYKNIQKEYVSKDTEDFFIPCYIFNVNTFCKVSSFRYKIQMKEIKILNLHFIFK